MTLTVVVGLLAGLLTTGAFLPQIIKTMQTKSVKNISLGMYIVYLIGVVMWFIYGFMIDQIAILICNSFSLVFGLIMLIMKLKYNGENK